MSSDAPTVTVVILAYDAEPWLEPAVDAALASVGVAVDVVVVDNGCTDGGIDRLAGRDGVKVVDAGTNLGFAGGCNLGVSHAAGDVVVLVNSDAKVEPEAIAALAAAAQHDGVGIATGSVRLADNPDLVNSAGNEIHCSGVSWSGGFEEPSSAHATARPVFAASGCALGIRRSLWNDLGGFDADFFAYYEDADLSMRTWQRGLEVVYVPDAVVIHRYEFSRRAEKYFLLERNRLFMVATCYEARTIALLLPLLAVLEVGFLVLAIREGWWKQKLRSWWWLVRNRSLVAARRADVHRARRVPDRDLAHLFCDDLLPGNIDVPEWWPTINRPIRLYWRTVRRWL
jgi:GT2 family glycosyltransferase